MSIDARKYMILRYISVQEPGDLPGEKSEYSDRPFDARSRLFGFALATSVAEVHGDDEQSDQHPDDRYSSPEHQRLQSDQHPDDRYSSPEHQRLQCHIATIGNESVPKTVINNTVISFIKLQSKFW